MAQLHHFGTAVTNQNYPYKEVMSKETVGVISTEVFTGICFPVYNTRVGTLIVASIYLQLIQNRYMFRSFAVLQCSHQHCEQPVASDVEVVGYL